MSILLLYLFIITSLQATRYYYFLHNDGRFCYLEVTIAYIFQTCNIIIVIIIVIIIIYYRNVLQCGRILATDQ